MISKIVLLIHCIYIIWKLMVETKNSSHRPEEWDLFSCPHSDWRGYEVGMGQFRHVVRITHWFIWLRSQNPLVEKIFGTYLIQIF